MRKPPAATPLVALTLGLVLAACSQDAEPTATETQTTPSASPSASSSAASPTTPADAPTSSEPTATMSVTEEPSPTMTSEPSNSVPDAPSVDVVSQLLPAGRMGKLNAEWTWQAGNDFDTEPRGVVSCNRFGLDEIGAENVAVREYTSDLDAGVRAHHLVAGFADETTARRAYSVLESWRSSCQQRLEQKSAGRDGIRVSDPDPVRGAGDAATSYLLIKPSPTGGSLIEDVAAARTGRVIHLAVVVIEGDDYNYPRGRTPAGVAVRNAAG